MDQLQKLLGDNDKRFMKFSHKTWVLKNQSVVQTGGSLVGIPDYSIPITVSQYVPTVFKITFQLFLVQPQSCSNQNMNGKHKQLQAFQL